MGKEAFGFPLLTFPLHPAVEAFPCPYFRTNFLEVLTEIEAHQLSGNLLGLRRQTETAETSSLV